MNEQFKKLTEEVSAKLLEQLGSEEIKSFVEKTKAAASDSGSFEVIISTDDQDRQGEVVDQNGLDTTLYMKNPVVLFGHDYYSLPIGICTEIVKEGNKTIARGTFAPADANPFAQQVRKLYDLGIMRATSVGFIAKEMNGNTITKSELLEFSFVPVPANPYALSTAKALELQLDVEMIKAKGIGIEIKDAAEPQEGDACQLDDGSDGVMTMDTDTNELVCKKKEAKSEEAQKEETETITDPVIEEEKPAAVVEPVVEKAGRRLSSQSIQTLVDVNETLKKLTVTLDAFISDEQLEPESDEGSAKSTERSKRKELEAALAGLNAYQNDRKFLRAVSASVNSALRSINENKKVRK